MDRNTTERSAFAKGLLLAVPTILIWGVTFVDTKALLDDFSAFEILLLRFRTAQYKRNCVPDGPKITLSLSPRADWRMPSDM